MDIFDSYLRKRILFILIVGFTFLVIVHLFQMQILENLSYEKKSNDNSVKKEIFESPRGVFYDRYYNVLVSNKPSFTFRITPSKYNYGNSSILEKVISAGNGYIPDILTKNKHLSKFTPIKIKKDVDFNFIAWYEENSEKLPGVDYAVELQRDYSFGVNGAHVFGYVKEISANQLERNKEEYSQGDVIGYTGLERKYENLLRGEKGYNLYLVDSKQEQIGRYNDGKDDRKPVKGNDLVLTLDAGIQQLAEEKFIGKRGALVAIEPATGEILAFVSSPTYKLTDFDAVTSNETWKMLQNDEDRPLYNRASMSVNSPGSTFKIMNALVGLQDGVITPETRVVCNGGLQVGDRFFHCMHVHGSVDLMTAIEKSCNTYFYQLILKLNLDSWAKYCSMFGFGESPGLDIPEEASGLLPNSAYYDKIIGKGRWGKGRTVNLGIGQGELGVTVIQLAKYVALVANEGKSKSPHFVKGYIRNEDREFVPLEFPEINVSISKENFKIVKEGMYLVVNGSGSAGNIRNDKIKIAGKTGTSQNPHGDNHALFIGFAPYDNPQIAVAVLVENVGFGSTHAAPIARDVILAYMENKKANTDKNYITSSIK